MSDEPKISGRYRELPREEPPRALDDAILAASRRAVDARPAPLVVPTGRRHWYFPVAAAAIIVLAVAVTVHVERERPADEIVVAVEPAKEVLREEAPPVAQAPPAEAPAAARGARKAERAPERLYVPDPKPAAPAAAPPSEQQPRALGRAQESASADRAGKTDALAKRADEASAQLRQAEAARERREVMASAAAPASRFARATPEQWLLAIDDLKRQGKHDEAERELAEFRKRHPNYRIPEAITEKFEKR